jgi:hypothetical protein
MSPIARKINRPVQGTPRLLFEGATGTIRRSADPEDPGRTGKFELGYVRGAIPESQANAGGKERRALVVNAAGALGRPRTCYFSKTIFRVSPGSPFTLSR